MEEPQHVISVTRGDVTVKVSGEKSFVTEQFADLSETYLNDDGGTTAESNSDIENTEKRISLGELYTTADISYKRDAALLVGWYLESIEDKSDFTKSEIKDRALQAKVELGKNLSRDLSMLIEQGKLQEVASRGGETTYYLTRTGEEYVESDFGIEDYV